MEGEKTMYQVLELYGNFEPWWFLEDWKDDIVSQSEFDTFEEALKDFKTKWLHLKVSHPFYQSNRELLAAFWNQADQTWCEDCAEDLQVYSSLALLKDWEVIPPEQYQVAFDSSNKVPKDLSACQINLKKIG